MILMALFAFECISAAKEPVVIDLSKALGKGDIAMSVFRVVDPVYLGVKRYEGYPLDELLNKVPGIDQLRSSDAELLFLTLDGYTPTMPLRTAYTKKGLIAVRDLGAEDGHDWVPFKKGGSTATPAPFYLVWKGLIPNVKEYPWPYQLKKIVIVDPDEYYGPAFPKDASEQIKGYEVYKKYCIVCHSVNLAGGTFGPELNVPKNITEYWRLKFLREYIKDPRSFSANSKMPSFKNIGDDELESLISYFKYMRNFKVCGGGVAMPCGAR